MLSSSGAYQLSKDKLNLTALFSLLLDENSTIIGPSSVVDEVRDGKVFLPHSENIIIQNTLVCQLSART